VSALLAPFNLDIVVMAVARAYKIAHFLVSVAVAFSLASV